MKFEKLGRVTKNLDNKRIPLNSSQRDGKSKEGLYPYIGANNIMGYINEYIFDEKILCLAEDGGSWGNGQICANIYNEKCWVNNHAHVLTENGKVNLEYLRYFLNKEDLNKYITGTTRGKLTKTALENILVPLPPLSDQLHIANILSKAENLISQRKQSIALLDDFLKSIYCELFNKYEGKKIQRLESIASITSGLTKGKKYEGKTTRFLPYMRVANVQDGFLNLQEIKEIEATEDEINRFNLRFGDLLLTEGGDPDKLGRGTTWKNQIQDCIFQNHIFRVRINNIKEINPVFLSFQTGSIYGKKYFLKSAKQTTGIASINSTQLKKFPAFIPPFALQSQFAQIVEKVDALKVQCHSSLQELENLYGSISQQAFRGELTLNKAEEQVLMAAEPEEGYNLSKRKDIDCEF